jgi:hypothetical protein
MEPMSENSQKRLSKRLLSISGIAVLLMVLGIGAFTLTAPRQSAHADPPPPGGSCLSGTLSNDGPIADDPAHAAKVTVHVFNVCQKTVNNMTASITAINNCPGLGNGAQSFDLSLGSAGTIEHRSSSAGVGGNCVVCHYTNGFLSGTEYRAFTMTVMLDGITGIDSSGNEVDLGENSGLLTISFPNGGPSTDPHLPPAPACPLTQP